MADEKPTPNTEPPAPTHPVPPPQPNPAWDNFLKKGGDSTHHPVKVTIRRGG
jgi:hypothetical protein